MLNNNTLMVHSDWATAYVETSHIINLAKERGKKRTVTSVDTTVAVLFYVPVHEVVPYPSISDQLTIDRYRHSGLMGRLAGGAPTLSARYRTLDVQGCAVVPRQPLRSGGAKSS